MQNSILKTELESGFIDKPILVEVLDYAVKQSRLYLNDDEFGVERGMCIIFNMFNYQTIHLVLSYYRGFHDMF